jgi:phosphoribosylformylglycinamidine synthase subunit PurSL
MPHRIEVCLRKTLDDPAGRRVKDRIASDLDLSVEDLRVADAYIIDRDLNLKDLDMIVAEVFRDPVIQEAAVDEPLAIPFHWLIEVGFRPGVTDNVGRTAREAIERTLQIRFSPDEGVYTRKLYFIRGDITREQAERIARDLLANDLIQTRMVFAPSDDRSVIAVPKVT